MENYRFERVKKITEDLSSMIVAKSIPVTAFKMKKGFFLTPKAADEAEGEWLDFNSSTDIWPGPDAHYWFRVSIEIPDEFDKRATWMSFVTQCTFWDAVNPQFLVFVNGEPVQGLDTNHREVRLCEKAKSGEQFVIDLQAYTGRDNDHNQGSTEQLRLLASLILLDEKINNLYYNILIPNRIVSHLERDNTSRLKLELALEKAINLLDLRTPYSKEFYASVDEANRFLETEVYKKLAGSDEVIATCIGHTHIDVAWWWTVEQSREKSVRSFATVLRFMEEYPDYKFMSSQPQLYQFVKDRYPDIYEKIKKRVKEGRWETEGGMWVEADCNVTSGESLVRQFLHGKKFFKDEFDKDNKILWLPDVFGYSAALPQILKKSGIDYFMTTKIAWNQFNKLPVDTFWWKGIDGTEVFTHLVTTQDVEQPKDSFYTTYNGKLDPICLMRAWERYQHKELNNDVLISYGYGDGGGGPTREMLETGKRMEKGVIGSPKVRMDFSRKYFDELYERVSKNPDLPRWVGELYLEYHRGTYTSMARNKRSNRKCEFLWQDVEFFGVFGELFGVPFTDEEKAEAYKAWENILLNQFHDILPGSSIKEVYEVTRLEYAALEKRANELIAEKLSAISKACKANDGDLILFNSLSFERNDAVVVAGERLLEATSLKSCDGQRLPIQKTADGKIVFSPDKAVAKGFTVFTPCFESESFESKIKIDKSSIETPFYSISLDKAAQFTSIFDKQANREILKKGEKGNVLRVYEDKPIYYDNWDIDIYYTQKSWVADDLTSFEVIENGPVRAVLELQRKFLDSTIIQKIIFYPNSRRIDFDTYVDWKQHQLLLKCEFPVDINTNEATYEIQFGNLKRPTHKNTSWDVARFEVCGHKWADLSENGYGVALLNDCKYGYGITEGKMTLSLIKSGVLPNPTTDQEEHFFTYALLPHACNLDESDVIKQGYCLNAPMRGLTVSSPEARFMTASMLQIDSPNVVVETIKPALDGNGVIVRMYESKNRRTSAKLSWHDTFESAVECDLMENPTGTAISNADAISFEIKPFEIKSFRIK